MSSTMLDACPRAAVVSVENAAKPALRFLSPGRDRRRARSPHLPRTASRQVEGAGFAHPGAQQRLVIALNAASQRLLKPGLRQIAEADRGHHPARARRTLVEGAQ